MIMYKIVEIRIYIHLGMGTARSNGSKWKGMLGCIMRKVRTTFSEGKGVKQGHFVVIATQGWKQERFVVELGYLDDPSFVKLLKQAEEEFGFSQAGALAIPCDPDDLKTIIAGKKQANT